MVVTLLNWIYITATAYFAGHFILKRLAKVLDKDNTPAFCWADYLMGGLAATALYAGFFSLISGVCVAANIILVLACAVFAYFDRGSFRADYEADRLKGRQYLILIPIVIMGVLILMFTAVSTFHYDTGLYHAQTIHWIEDYGIIKGLGLLHQRFAYNSQYLPLCALYSMKFLTGGQSLHSISGLITMILCTYSIWGWARSVSNGTFLKKSAVSDMLRIAPFLYMISILIEITSPESDYMAIIFIIWICIRFAELTEADGDNTSAFCILALMAFADVTYKLSAALIVLVTLKPLYVLIKNKKWKNIAICGGIAALLMVPYLVRNVLICGWLIYPFDAIDIFNTPWKFDAGIVSGDAGEIGAWAKNEVNGDGQGITGRFAWIKNWWDSQYLATQLFIKSVIYAFPVMLLSCLEGFIRLVTGKYKALPEKEWSRRVTFLHMMGMMIIFMIFYMVKAPLIRYGYGPVLIFPMLVMGYVISAVSFGKDAVSSRRHIAETAAVAVITLCVLLPDIKCVPALVKFDYEEGRARFDFAKYLVSQVDYPEAEVNANDWHGITVYTPKEGDQCWYYAFPSTPYPEALDNTELIGDDLSDGLKRSDR